MIALDAVFTMPRNERFPVIAAALSVALALCAGSFHAVAYEAMRAGLHATPIRIDALGPADPLRTDILEEALRAAPFVASVTRVRREDALAEASDGSADIARVIAAYPVANPFPDALSVTLRSADGYDDLFALLETGSYDDVLGDGMPAIRAQARNALIVVHTLRLASSMMLWFTVMAGVLAAMLCALLVAQSNDVSSARRALLYALGAGVAVGVASVLCMGIAGRGIPVVGAALYGVPWRSLVLLAGIAAWPALLLRRAARGPSA